MLDRESPENDKRKLMAAVDEMVLQETVSSQSEADSDAASDVNSDSETPAVQSFRWEAEDQATRAEQLISTFHADVYRYSCWLANCPNAAEDITQEVFLRAYRGLHNLREEQAAKSWLLTITRNEFARWCKKSRERTLSESAERELENQTGSNQSTEVFENAEWVNNALKELPDDFRSAVVMYYFESMSYADISEALEIPIGTVMSRLNRAKSHLKKHLKD